MSQSVANALEMQDRFYTTSTRKFIRTFDRTFDCLNVSKIKQVVKIDLKPYFNMGDPRFQVVYFFIKLTYPLCHLFCLIPIKCYLQIWDHSLNLYPFSRVNLPQNGCVSGAWEFALEKRLLKKWGLVTWEIGG